MNNNSSIGIIAIGILIFGAGTLFGASIVIFNPFTVAPPPVIGEAPLFTLINQDNENVSLLEFRGRVVLLGFIYTQCPDQDFCILLSADMKKIQDTLSDRMGSDFIMLSISFDPETDTPSVLKAYGEALQANFDGWQFLTGSNDSISTIMDNYGVFAVPEEFFTNASGTSFKGQHHIFVHSFNAVLIDQKGQIRFLYSNPAFSSESSWSVSKAVSHITSLF